MQTVITRAATARLATVEDARLDLGLSEAAITDVRLGRLLDQASSRAAGFCNRAFGRQIYRQQILTVPAGGIILDGGPINRIISVEIVGGAVFEEGDYLLNDGKLSLTYGAGRGDGTDYNLWQSLHPTLAVVFEAGWLLPGEEVGDTFTGEEKLPAEIERAAIQLAGAALSENSRDALVKSETVEGIGTTSYYVQGAAAALPHPGAEAALQPYRILALA